ncbi:MAG: hypothetical protein WAU65_00255 [Candidatus Nanoarchaeia archaeon]
MNLEKHKMEKEMVEEELSSLLEITFRLEDEVNSFLQKSTE